ncbi:MAG TPA: nuclear transport factor 2 family protein [Gemmatimonas sp.]|nr:nuclear transport factor 2 family protein [Gemmatimonas sp.]
MRCTRHWHVALFATLSAVAMLGATACNSPPAVSAAQRSAIADTLRALIEDAYDFSKPDAPARLLSLYPDSGRVISAAAGRITTSRDSLQAEIAGFWERVGQNMQNPTFVLGSSYVDVLSHDAVVMTFTYKVPHRTPEGRPHTIGGAWTTFWRRQDGRWRIVQEHLSDAAIAPDDTGASLPSPRPPDSTARP